MEMDAIEVEPDVMLPAQYIDNQFRGARLQPEKRLQLAVLTDALMTYVRCRDGMTARARRLFGEVAEWFASDVADGPFSFVAVCDSLGLHPDYVRRGLGAGREKGRLANRRRLIIRRDSGLRTRVVGPRIAQVA